MAFNCPICMDAAKERPCWKCGKLKGDLQAHEAWKSRHSWLLLLWKKMKQYKMISTNPRQAALSETTEPLDLEVANMHGAWRLDLVFERDLRHLVVKIRVARLDETPEPMVKRI